MAAEFGDDVACALDEVLNTAELGRRPSRPPNYEAESRALSALARELATNPRELLQQVAEALMVLCRPDSAGISILEPCGAEGVLRCHAVAGAFTPQLNGSMPRESTPCGAVMARRTVLLFDRPARSFPALRALDPPIYELLATPWEIDGRVAGTLWAIGHTAERRFDAEDARQLASLSRFVAAAWQTVRSLDAAIEWQAELALGVERRSKEVSAAEAALRDSQERLEAALVAGRMAAWQWDPASDRVVTSDTTSELWGLLRGQTLTDSSQGFQLVHPDDVARHRAVVDAARQRGGSWRSEFRIIRPRDGRIAWLEERANAVRDPLTGKMRLDGLIWDITARKQAEEQLRHRTAQFETLVNESPIGVYLIDGDFRVRQVNPVAQLVFGDIPDLIGRDFDEVIHILWDPAYADELVRVFRHTLNTGTPCIARERAEFRIDRGTTEYYEWQIHRIPLPDGHPGVVCYFRDISEHVHTRDALRRAADELEARVRDRTAELAHANAALQGELRERQVAEARSKALFAQLITVQEEERRRIARNLHDQLGQQMTALRMNLESLRAQSDADPSLAAQTHRAQQLAQELDQSIDFLTRELRPASLDHLGLAESLANLVSGWSQRFGIPAEYDLGRTEGFRLAPEVETHLYRVAQEALHNVFKHAAATRVSVCLERQAGHAVLVVEDDGQGFSPAGVRRDGTTGHLGLVGMQERAALAGGDLEIESSPGGGTTIFVRVPVEDGAHDQR